MKLQVYPAKILFAAAISLLAANANAVPSFARQTGHACSYCHTIFPELTSAGRQFKLEAYTETREDKAQPAIPVSAMAMMSVTHTANTNGTGLPRSQAFPRDDGLVVQQLSLFYAGKITDKSGAFVQWTNAAVVPYLDGVGNSVNNQRHGNIDLTDIRYADKVKFNSHDLLYGFTLNNTPALEDIYNSTPVFGFPSSVSFGTSGVNGLIAPVAQSGGLTLGGTVAGAGGYMLWDDLVYGAVSMYQKAEKGPLGLMTVSDLSSLKGSAPYWRLALQHEVDEQSFMIGAFGMNAELYSDPADRTAPTNKFRDLGFDAQYQYQTREHTFTAQVSRINEKQTYDGSFVGVSVDNQNLALSTTRIKGTYLYQQKYGATLAYFSTTGDADATLYGSANKPDTRGYIAELNYLPVQNIKLSLQYTGYQKFNGAASNYDGSGRNASDNNTLYLLGWFMF